MPKKLTTRIVEERWIEDNDTGDVCPGDRVPEDVEADEPPPQDDAPGADEDTED